MLLVLPVFVCWEGGSISKGGVFRVHLVSDKKGQIDLFSVDLSSFTVLDSVEDTGPEEVCKSLTHLLYVGSWLISSHSFKKKKNSLFSSFAPPPRVCGGA